MVSPDALPIVRSTLHVQGDVVPVNEDGTGCYELVRPISAERDDGILRAALPLRLVFFRLRAEVFGE